MGNIHQAAMLVVIVMAIFAGLAILPAWRMDRRDAQQANENQSLRGIDSNEQLHDTDGQRPGINPSEK